MRTRTVVVIAAAAAAAWALGVGPPAPAAETAGQACADCHAELVEHFQADAHARLAEGDWFGRAAGCASCHGDVTAHLESADPEDVRGFPGQDPAKDAELCLGCHAASHGLGAWTASEHARSGLSCIDCHDPHAGATKAPPQARLGVRGQSAVYERCFECHPEVRAQIRLPSRHPLAEGKLDCGACHDVHGAYPGLLRTAGRVNDLCVECHPAQEGPFVFQHAPVEEDCTICHQPHGAVADHLLKQTQPFLCLQCHEAHFHAGLESPTDTNPTFGTVPPNTWDNPFGEVGMKHAFLTKCTQCHSSVHGSDSPSQSVPSRGGSLTR